jgi:hypothetical protein
MFSEREKSYCTLAALFPQRVPSAAISFGFWQLPVRLDAEPLQDTAKKANPIIRPEKRMERYLVVKRKDIRFTIYSLGHLLPF